MHGGGENIGYHQHPTVTHIRIVYARSRCGGFGHGAQWNVVKGGTSRALVAVQLDHDSWGMRVRVHWIGRIHSTGLDGCDLVSIEGSVECHGSHVISLLSGVGRRRVPGSV